jgi:hypothetical protein
MTEGFDWTNAHSIDIASTTNNKVAYFITIYNENVAAYHEHLESLRRHVRRWSIDLTVKAYARTNLYCRVY